MKASPEAQLRLLELADLDAELTRLENRRRGLPEHAELDQLEQRDARLRDTIASLEAEQGDLKRALGKAEADVDQVRSRIDRDRQRLDAGQVASPRELENLQSEIVSLTRRQSDLEEIVLDVMERQEAAQGSRESAAAEREEIAATRDVVTAAGTPRWPRSPSRPARRAIAGRPWPARSRRTCWTCTGGCASSTGESARPRCAAAGARAATSR